MKYSVSIDVPQLDAGVRFYRDALGLTEIARPVATYVILKCASRLRRGLLWVIRVGMGVRFRRHCRHEFLRQGCNRPRADIRTSHLSDLMGANDSGLTFVREYTNEQVTKPFRSP